MHLAMRFHTWAFIALAALAALTAPLGAQAQPSTNFVQRLATLEATVARLNQLVDNQATLINAQAAQISNLGNALQREVADRVAYADNAAANALVNARAYTDTKVAPLSDKLLHVSRNGNNLFINGANLHVRNGLGATLQNGVNGLGNLIVGYNEPRGQPNNPDVRSGSHNIVTGTGANYSRTSAFITGVNNTTNNHFASVLGGTGNTANGTYSVVVGGFNNFSNGGWSTILGGRDRVASNQLDHLP